MGWESTPHPSADRAGFLQAVPTAAREPGAVPGPVLCCWTEATCPFSLCPGEAVGKASNAFSCSFWESLE